MFSSRSPTYRNKLREEAGGCTGGHRSAIYSANPQLGLNHSLWESNSPFHRSLYCVHTHFDCFLLSLFLQN